MSDTVQLKPVMFTGTAALKGGEITGVTLTKYTIDGQDGKRVDEAPKVVAAADLAKAAFAAGDRVTVVGCDVAATIGSSFGCDWSVKKTCVGKTGVVTGIDNDGDVRVDGLEFTLFSPQFLRKVSSTTFVVGDTVTILDGRAITATVGSYAGCMWTPVKAPHVGKTATVARVEDDNDVVLKVGDQQLNVYWSPQFLRKFEYKIGDAVVCDHEQSGPPGWTDGMTPLLGRPGKIDAVDDDVLVEFAAGAKYYYAKSWVRPATAGEVEAHRLLDVALEAFKATPSDAQTVAKIVESALGKRPRADK